MFAEVQVGPQSAPESDRHANRTTGNQTHRLIHKKDCKTASRGFDPNLGLHSPRSQIGKVLGPVDTPLATGLSTRSGFPILFMPHPRGRR